MEAKPLADQVLATWNRHNEILLYLLQQVPREGWTAVPPGSRGRDVARQFAHLDRVRHSWVHYHRTGIRRSLPRQHSGPPPPKSQVARSLRQSGKDVAAFLRSAMNGEARPRLFGGQVVRWMGYLISHESHHRGQIALTLKQVGLRLPDKVAVDGLWGKWIYGK